MKTLHLGPEELLVAAKIGVGAMTAAEDVARAIDQAERAIRAVEPTAGAIYLEPDIFRSTYRPDARPDVPPPPGH